MKKGQTSIDFFFGISFLLIFTLWFVNYGGLIYKSRTNEYLAAREILSGIVNHANSVCATLVNITSNAPCPFNKDQNYVYNIQTGSPTNAVNFMGLKYRLSLSMNASCTVNFNFTITNCSTSVCYYYDGTQVNALPGVICS
ncbi:Uncharacterised protein [uncultured archaeon]|nr:Uncharacterised protein [uncultured archaeon]